MSPKIVPWAVVAATLAGAAWFAAAMTVGGDRSALLIGETTDAHHQIELACETCHAAPAFASAAKAEKALNRACRKCHDKELKAADDSHPRRKFRNPRMAVYWEKLDARLCTTCHVEHRPEIVRASAVTVAMDFCVACHSEGDQDVRAERPSHAGLAFDTCASAGCHNYHDNRALYEEFLVRHAGEPWLADAPAHELSARQRVRKRPARAALARGDAVAPRAALADPAWLDRWADSGHAAAGVNCGACHAPKAGKNATRETVEASWIEAPGTAVCEDCHRPQARTFVLGRHGMRRHPRVAKPRDPLRQLRKIGLSEFVPETVALWLADPAPPTTMTVAEARIPMRSDAAHGTLDCGTCHTPHAVDVRHAAAEACASCHDDPHTRAYFASPHHALWRAELAGEAPPGTGVSCATCHMPKTERRGRIATDHNQNDNLRPNEKMIRPVCLDCHGLGFSLNALADGALVERNFTGTPAVRVESIGWATRRAQATKREAGG
ncbi:MAG: cytochrome c3 family protein [Defluviicoccus sp.]|nr:cytochrome c3 family protein [Defluviicoccus sp.]MDE0275682.1 cytochrome c3 family protein [Defluviicoccus sp.]